jgi:hypothetical protein
MGSSIASRSPSAAGRPHSGTTALDRVEGS